MSATLELSPYLALVVAGFLPNEVWRWLGVLAARRLDEGSEVLVWVRAVATAVLAGVIAQLVFTPPGALALMPLTVRLAAIGGGFLVYLIARRSLIAGVLAGEAILVLGGYLAGV